MNKGTRKGNQAYVLKIGVLTYLERMISHGLYIPEHFLAKNRTYCKVEEGRDMKKYNFVS